MEVVELIGEGVRSTEDTIASWPFIYSFAILMAGFLCLLEYFNGAAILSVWLILCHWRARSVIREGGFRLTWLLQLKLFDGWVCIFQWFDVVGWTACLVYFRGLYLEGAKSFFFRGLGELVRYILWIACLRARPGLPLWLASVAVWIFKFFEKNVYWEGLRVLVSLIETRHLVFIMFVRRLWILTKFQVF